MRLLVIAIFASVRKDEEEKKNEEKKTKLWQLVSRKWLERFPSNLECRLPWLEGQLCSKFGSNQRSDHRDTKV